MGSFKNETDVVFLGHGDCLEDAQYVADKVKEKCGLDVWIRWTSATPWALPRRLSRSEWRPSWPEP